MAEITNATVTFTDYTATPADPRLLNIPDAWGDAEVQDITDTLSAKQAELDNLIYDPLLDGPGTSGKQELSPTKSAGLITTMIRTNVKFEDLGGPAYTIKRTLNGSLVAIDGEVTRVAIEEMANSTFVNWKTEADVSAALINGGSFASQASVELNHYMGSIWVDAANGTAGSVVGTNGTPGNPVAGLADALTLVASTGFRSLVLVSGSLTLTSAITEYLIEMRNESELLLNGQNVNGTEFRGGKIKGVMTGVITCRSVHLEDVNGFRGDAQLCGIQGTITLGAGTSGLDLCHSDTPGLSTPTLVFGDATAKANLRSYSGGIQVESMTLAAHVMSAEFIRGQLILDSSCTGGTFVPRGEMPFTDNSAGTTVNVAGHIPPALGKHRGAIWIDSVNGVAGAVLGVNGTEENPVDNETDALLLATALGTRTLKIANAFTFTVTYEGFEFISWGENAQINPNNQLVHRCIFRECQVSGDFIRTGQLDRNTYYDCLILNVTNFAATCYRCGFLLNVGVSSNFPNIFVDCYQAFDSTMPTFDGTDAVGGSTSVSLYRWSGDAALANFTVAGIHGFFGLDGSAFTIDATVTEGDFKMGGNGKLIDNSTGNTVVASDELIQPLDVMRSGRYAGAIWWDSGNGTPGAVLGVNGTEDNPVDNETDALALTALLGTKRLHVKGIVTLTAPYDGFHFDGTVGEDGLVLVNGQRVQSCVFDRLLVVGDFDAAQDDRNIFTDCVIADVTNLLAQLIRCGITGTIGVRGNAGFQWVDCYNGSASVFGPLVVDFTAVASSNNWWTIQRWSGDIRFANLADGFVNLLGVKLGMVSGTATVDATIADGTWDFSGIGKLVDNSTGSAVVTDELVDPAKLLEVWQFIGLDIGESVTAVAPTGDGAGFEGTTTIGTMTFKIERQGGGTTMIMTRLT